MSDPALPAELVAFLRSSKALDYDASTCEAGRVTLRPLETLRVQLFPTDVQGSSIAKQDPHLPNLGCYLVPAVDLLDGATGDYEPTGLLLWFPTERRFGTWDSSHTYLAAFDPTVTWDQIAASPARFINAQWEGSDDDSPPTEPLVPWPRHAYSPTQLFEPQPT